MLLSPVLNQWIGMNLWKGIPIGLIEETWQTRGVVCQLTGKFLQRRLGWIEFVSLSPHAHQVGAKAESCTG